MGGVNGLRVLGCYGHTVVIYGIGLLWDMEVVMGLSWGLLRD